MAAKSNRELVEEFTQLLTAGVYGPSNIPPDEFLAATKPWRADLWVAFREIADRLCPLDALAREKAKADDTAKQVSQAGSAHDD